MIPDEIIFNEDLEMYFFQEELNQEIRLVLSDGLYASEEELTEDYKRKIADFISDKSNWYTIAVGAVIKRATDVYHTDANYKNVKLQSVFVLFEQNEQELYGLGFRTEFDMEHGCGIKISGKDYKIIEIGTWDVAFA